VWKAVLNLRGQTDAGVPYSTASELLIQ
jgi:hypothetical protein